MTYGSIIDLSSQCWLKYNNPFSDAKLSVKGCLDEWLDWIILKGMLPESRFTFSLFMNLRMRDDILLALSFSGLYTSL